MRTLRLVVGGMGCRRCVRKVTAHVRDVPGVETVVADAERAMVTLSGSMTLTDVLAAFVGTNFTLISASEPAEQGDDA